MQHALLFVYLQVKFNPTTPESNSMTNTTAQEYRAATFGA